MKEKQVNKPLCIIILISTILLCNSCTHATQSKILQPAEKATALMRFPAGLLANYGAKDPTLKRKTAQLATAVRMANIALHAMNKKSATFKNIAPAAALELFIGISSLIKLKQPIQKIKLTTSKAMYLEEVLLPLHEAFLSYQLAHAHDNKLQMILLVSRIVDHLVNNTHVGLALKSLLATLGQPHHASSPLSNSGKATLQYLYAAALLCPVLFTAWEITRP